MFFMGAILNPTSPGSLLDADHPENGVLIPCRLTLASLIETCKLNKVDPEAYLAEVITRIVQGLPTAAWTNYYPGHTAPRQLTWPENSAYYKSKENLCSAQIACALPLASRLRIQGTDSSRSTQSAKPCALSPIGVKVIVPAAGKGCSVAGK